MIGLAVIALVILAFRKRRFVAKWLMLGTGALIAVVSAIMIARAERDRRRW